MTMKLGTLTLAGSLHIQMEMQDKLISVTDSGGDGALAYNNSTGVITYAFQVQQK